MIEKQNVLEIWHILEHTKCVAKIALKYKRLKNAALHEKTPGMCISRRPGIKPALSFC